MKCGRKKDILRKITATFRISDQNNRQTLDNERRADSDQSKGRNSVCYVMVRYESHGRASEPKKPSLIYAGLEPGVSV